MLTLLVILWVDLCLFCFFFFKQKTAYEMRISDWSSDVCSSDLHSDAIVGTDTAITNFSHCDVADAEIEKARETADEAERLRLWAVAQQKIHDAVCAVPLFSLMQVWQRSKALDYGYELKGSMNLAPPITESTTLNR